MALYCLQTRADWYWGCLFQDTIAQHESHHAREFRRWPQALEEVPESGRGQDSATPASAPSSWIQGTHAYQCVSEVVPCWCHDRGRPFACTFRSGPEQRTTRETGCTGFLWRARSSRWPQQLPNRASGCGDRPREGVHGEGGQEPENHTSKKRSPCPHRRAPESGSSPDAAPHLPK